MLPSKETLQFLMPYKFAVDELKTKLKIIQQEAYFSLEHNPIEHMKFRVKSPESMTKKLKRKGAAATLTSAKNVLNDIVGARIVCCFEEDIYFLRDLFYSRPDLTVVEEKDYIKEPKSNGYRSLHLIVEVPVVMHEKTEMVRAEIQIRTIAMDFWASVEHKIFYKYDREIPTHLKEELSEAASAANELDLKMAKVRKEIQNIENAYDSMIMH
ncbi:MULTISPECIES: GTP pyrophosphokinase [Priestia]|jgi:putative GTP pyrophosphokinase|uniref:GTP pyrophosphokinase n=1 Tax=Priestia filamentosa TaxID=1402861 RepID=A0A1X7F8P7_9BACI|nr:MULTISPECIES: GTP pyrophosphokinase family protein [Priestia]AKO91851.1 GTP pyrophosphokinase [Priestia filamentosa]MCY8235420.1 GTP pyrophosphokinase family protein [Priestia endophytica]MDT3761997.1 GTP pyrophosphokinase family protein [Priestia filamentosa]MED3727264.1 GTP pyrophosphokinase family protein [Priestia filamentosa]MED4073565.1 GTP pyrophosphokinase family protein [Priestia endophytica]